MLIDHMFFECGFEGEANAIHHTIVCPGCKTVNDVWFKGETPPVRHMYDFIKEEIKIDIG